MSSASPMTKQAQYEIELGIRVRACRDATSDLCKQISGLAGECPTLKEQFENLQAIIEHCGRLQPKLPR